MTSLRKSQHISLLAQALSTWAAFWVLGLPNYYQQYDMLVLALGCIILTILISLVALAILLRVRPEKRMDRACWIAFYFSLPFALLDIWYCAFYLGHGSAFIAKFWYLSIFYVSPWLTFPPTAWILGKEK
jgi:hypothetical protein